MRTLWHSLDRRDGGKDSSLLDVTQLEKVRRSAEGLPCDHGAFWDVLTCNE